MLIKTNIIQYYKTGLGKSYILLSDPKILHFCNLWNDSKINLKQDYFRVFFDELSFERLIISMIYGSLSYKLEENNAQQ